MRWRSSGNASTPYGRSVGSVGELGKTPEVAKGVGSSREVAGVASLKVEESARHFDLLSRTSFSGDDQRRNVLEVEERNTSFVRPGLLPKHDLAFRIPIAGRSRLALDNDCIGVVPSKSRSIVLRFGEPGRRWIAVELLSSSSPWAFVPSFMGSTHSTTAASESEAAASGAS